MKLSIRWAFRALILSISLSIVFGMLSQGLFPALPTFLSVLVIFFFIFVSVLFDMIGIAFTSLSKDDLVMCRKTMENDSMIVKLFENKDKISSFCGDIVGDICGILSGAGGVSVVVNMNIQDPNIYFITTCAISSFIAGLTIFGKAVMKGYAVNNCQNIAKKTAKLISKLEFKKKQKNKKNL